MSTQVDLGAKVLLYVVHNFRSKVVALLLRNGVVVPSGSTDVQVAQLVTELLKVSKNFYAEFMKLLSSKEVVGGLASSFDGYANAGGAFDTSLGYKSQFATTDFLTKTPVSDLANKSIDSNTKKSGGFDWNKVLSGVEFGVTSYLQADKNKTDRALANASVTTSQNQVLLSQGGTKTGSNTKGGSNTVLWVVLGLLGVAGVGTAIYFATKKK
jgi:hypothetical protein